METGLFEIQAEHLRDYRHASKLIPHSQATIDAVFGRPDLINNDSHIAAPGRGNLVPNGEIKSDAPAIEFARCFLRLANLPNFALDRLSRYEASLWRQAGWILCALERLDRRKPQERTRIFGRSRWNLS